MDTDTDTDTDADTDADTDTNTREGARSEREDASVCYTDIPYKQISVYISSLRWGHIAVLAPLLVFLGRQAG